MDRQFIGQARLARLLLWKVGDSTDVDACLEAALDGKMISPDDALFLKECMDAEESSRNSGNVPLDVTPDLVTKLRRCVDKLNRADCA